MPLPREDTATPRTQAQDNPRTLTGSNFTSAALMAIGASPAAKSCLGGVPGPKTALSRALPVVNTCVPLTGSVASTWLRIWIGERLFVGSRVAMRRVSVVQL